MNPDCPLCLTPETKHYFEKKEGETPKDYFECPVCRLIFLDPAHHLNPEEEKKRYDTHNNSPDDAGYVDFLNRLIEPISEKLNPGDTGLDFGSGPGPTLSLLMKGRGFEVSNYDPLYTKDETPLSKQYDFITCTEAAEHFHTPHKEFELFGKLLKPERSVLGIMTQMVTPSVSFESWWYHKDPTHVCFYSNETFEWLGDKYGWKVEYPKENVTLLSRGLN